MIVFRIKQIREHKNISAYKLSKMTDISRSYLSEIENNKIMNVSLSALMKIAEALDVNIKDLFYTTFDIDSLKEKMYTSIHENGINATETLEISQLIDLLINIKMNEKLDNDV